MSVDKKEHQRFDTKPSIKRNKNHQRFDKNLESNVTNNTMTSTVSTLFDGTEITKNDGGPTHKNLKYCRKELAAIFATVNCTIDKAKNREHSLLAYTDLQWLPKTNITATVSIPVQPGEFTGSTHAERYNMN